MKTKRSLLVVCAQLGLPIAMWAMFSISAKAASTLFYAAVYDSGNVYAYDTGGTPSLFATVTNAYRLAVDSGGNVLVGDIGANAIYKYTPGGVQSTFATGVTPYGLDFDSSGNLFVLDFGGTIYKYTIGGVQSTFATGLSEPQDLVIDAADNVFVTDFDTEGVILKFTPGGAQSVFASGSFNPGSLAFGTSGDLYMSNGINTVFAFTPGGVQSTYATGFTTPTGMDFDVAGNLLVAEYFSRISIVPPGGGSRSTYDDPASGTYYDIAMAPLPEPSRAVLLMLGLGTTVMRRRRR